jgi:superfamily II DNA or RNA helicase
MEGVTNFSPGTLVQARRRLWRVDAQDYDVIYLTALDEATRQIQLYLPVETVSLGSLPRPDPNIVGTTQAHDLMLRAFRLSMVHSTAPLLSLQRSRAIPVEYQLVPLVMALEQPRVRLLIADDIGLGKTIEAGLVITELIARGLARRILVVCPASLREQWKQALDYFFHLEAVIFSRTHHRALERDLPAGSNPWEFHNVFIVSVDYAKTPEIKNQILEVSWDVVVVDEAHQIAKPHQTGPDQRVTMDRYELGMALASSPKIRHLLMLTATPHNGYTDSFASLLRFLDVGAVEGPDHAPCIHHHEAREHVIQRRRQDVNQWVRQTGGQGSHFPERDQDEVTVQPSAQELEVIDEVNHYGELILENARGAQIHIQILAGWVVLHLHKRALSSPEALRCSLRNRRDALEKRLTGLTEMDPGLPFEAARAHVLDEDPGEQFDEVEIGDRSEKVTPGDSNALQAELQALDHLEELAARVRPTADSKLKHLLRNTLRGMLAQRHKAIIFTHYRDTMSYVAEQIGKSDLYSHVRVVTLHGGMNDAQRQEAFIRFEQAKDAVLVATDAISEGINLQYLASQIIHYELPWNPNRLEQRNGRVDRFGQPEATVVIRTMVMDDTLDATILKLLVEKARRIRDDYGFSPPYFGDERNILDFIQEHGLGIRLGPVQLGLFDALPQDNEQPKDPFDEELLNRIREESFYGQTNITLGVVEEQMRQVRQSVGSPEEIRRFVLSGLNRLHCGVIEKDDGTLRIAIGHPDLHLPGTGSEIAKATFDPQLGLDHPDVEVLDLGHPLVRRMTDILKRQAFEPERDRAEEQAHYGRTAVLLTPDVAEMTALYTLLVRFTTETHPPQIMEDLLTVAVPLYNDQPLDENIARRLMEARPDPGTVTLGEACEVIRDALQRANLDQIFTDCIETRRKALEDDRQRLRNALQLQAGWLEGADRLQVSSWDLLAVKILWPT